MDAVWHSERANDKQQEQALESSFNVDAALSNDDAAGFRLKYTQLTLNWPAPIMGPARTDAYSFGQQECMAERRCSSLVLRHGVVRGSLLARR